MTTKDWVDWHRGYDDPDSPLSWRLRRVQERIRRTLDQAATGTIRIASLCAGDGRDLLDVLVNHPRTGDVQALLVEQNPDLAHQARRRASNLRGRIDVITGDASDTEVYTDIVPVDLLIVCGIFGNISDEDIRRTIRTLPAFCRRGATAIWTRHRRSPDLVPTICRWFTEAGFTDQATDTFPPHSASVTSHRYSGPPTELHPGTHLFKFR